MRPLFRSALILATLCLTLPAFADEAYSAKVTVKPLFKGTQTSLGQPLHLPLDGQAEATMLEVTIPPGAETGWHSHPYSGFGYVVAGTLQLEFEGGKSAQFSAGQGFAEVVNTLHNGKNTGSEVVKLWVVFTNEAGKPYAIKPAKPAAQ